MSCHLGFLLQVNFSTINLSHLPSSFWGSSLQVYWNDFSKLLFQGSSRVDGSMVVDVDPVHLHPLVSHHQCLSPPWHRALPQNSDGACFKVDNIQDSHLLVYLIGWTGQSFVNLWKSHVFDYSLTLDFHIQCTYHKLI